ncbi:hypothetical protein Mycsm_06485 [Mycobacterium sp. JS623]|nr:hypothetical protein Mycsm_06485 [Mycobacterium sp. JS623]
MPWATGNQSSNDLATEAEVDELKRAVAAHLDDPQTTVFFGPYIQAWGRKPG